MIGVDTSPEMLALAREKVPEGTFYEADLPLVKIGPDGNFGYMPIWSRLASDYLAAALPLGLQVRRCEEPRRPYPMVDEDGTDL